MKVRADSRAGQSTQASQEQANSTPRRFLSVQRSPHKTVARMGITRIGVIEMHLPTEKARPTIQTSSSSVLLSPIMARTCCLRLATQTRMALEDYSVQAAP